MHIFETLKCSPRGKVQPLRSSPRQISQWEDFGLVKASRHRQHILRLLLVKPLTPIDVAKALRIHLSQVTRNLRELENRGLIECKTPRLRKGRLYAITKKGAGVVGQLKGGGNA